MKETKEKSNAAKEGGDIKVLTDFMLIKQEEMTEEKKNKKNGHFMVYAGEIFNFLSNFGILGILLYFLDQHQSVEHIYGTACLIIISFAISFYDWSEKLINLLSKYFFHPYFKK